MTSSLIAVGRVAFAAALAVTLASAAHAQRVSRDSAGDALRAPTTQEVQTLDAAKASRAVGLRSGRPNPPAVRYKDGTVEQELDTSSLMYSVARRNPDGSISQYCVTGADAAEKLVKDTHAPVSAKAAKEHTHEVK